IDHDGRGLQVLGVIAGLENPSGREGLDVGRVDLVERAVAPGELRATVMRPVRTGSAYVLGVGERGRKKQEHNSHGDHDRSDSPGVKALLFSIAVSYKAQDHVEKVIKVFNSFEEADEADAREYARMTPQERLKILLDLRDLRHPDAAQQGLARVCRVV